MKTVSDILQVKGTTVWSVRVENTVRESLELMAEHNIGAVLVFEGERLAGIFSERDYARRVVLRGKSSRGTPISEVMVSDVIYVRPEQSIDDCMGLMTDRHLRHLPVIEDDRVVGMISIGDVVKAIIARQGSRISQLENHIKGTDDFQRF